MLQLKKFPDIPVSLERKHECPAHIQRSPISAEVSRGKSHLTSGTSKGSFTPLLQLKEFPDIPVSLERMHESPANIQRSPVSAS